VVEKMYGVYFTVKFYMITVAETWNGKTDVLAGGVWFVGCLGGRLGFVCWGHGLQGGRSS
jgi:hypothetical protein